MHRLGNLEIDVESSADGDVVLTWRGASDARDPGDSLDALLARVTLTKRPKSLTLDFRELEYMNSATVGFLVTFVKRLDKSGTKATLCFDAQLGWQRVNYQCMKTIARTLQNLDVRGDRHA